MGSDPMIGRRFSAYRITAELGRGGFATVYLAVHESLGRPVALKVLWPHLSRDQEFIDRFMREARAAAVLRHPNIVQVHDVGQQDGYYYIVMDYVDGESLLTLLGKRKRQTLEFALSIVEQIGSALDYAHAQGVVHRDVKPSNILIDKQGRAYLSDFGIAKAAWGSKITKTGMSIGTPEYMSPEQADGKGVDHRSDVYSLGILLYEMLTGRPPFEADTPVAVLYHQVHASPESVRKQNPQAPKDVEKVVSRVLAKDPNRRYQNCSALVEDLRGALAGLEAESAKLRRRKKAKPPPRVQVTPLREVAKVEGAEKAAKIKPAHRKRSPKTQIAAAAPDAEALVSAHGPEEQPEERVEEVLELPGAKEKAVEQPAVHRRSRRTVVAVASLAVLTLMTAGAVWRFVLQPKPANPSPVPTGTSRSVEPSTTPISGFEEQEGTQAVGTSSSMAPAGTVTGTPTRFRRASPSPTRRGGTGAPTVRPSVTALPSASPEAMDTGQPTLTASPIASPVQPEPTAMQGLSHPTPQPPTATQPAVQPTAQQPTATRRPTRTPFPTGTRWPTWTPRPTNTVPPTDTPAPSDTPMPTATEQTTCTFVFWGTVTINGPNTIGASPWLTVRGYNPTTGGWDAVAAGSGAGGNYSLAYTGAYRQFYIHLEAQGCSPATQESGQMSFSCGDRPPQVNFTVTCP